MVPLIGRIIRKKLSEALKDLVNYINNRIESLTSLTLWKYRFQSFRSGIPLAEIVFRNSIPYLVEEIMLIDKKTSVLLAGASWRENANTDRDIVAAMLSAIKDFIKTSFSKEEKYLNEISFGDSKIIIFESMYFYSAVVLYGQPEEQFFNSLDIFINSLHVKFRQKLKKFDGSMNGLEQMTVLISDFISKTNAGVERIPVKVSYTRLKVITAAVAAVIAVSMIIFTVKEIRDYRLEKTILENIETSLPAYTHDINADVDGGTVTVTGSVNSPKTGDLITAVVSGFPEIKNVINKTITSDFSTVEKFNRKISGFENKFKDLELLFIKQELEKIIIEFPSGVSAIGENQALQIKKIYEILRGYPDIDVDIIAFNDTSGGVEVNRRLANNRMNAIKNNLTELGINKEKIHITDFNPDVINADYRYRDYKDKRGIFLFARRSGN
ncbi:MAG: BON domain-containing protein [Spirochaetes bacterium]|nr:BON domain-containing protein [Spirochaetota bacterium]